MAEEATDLNLGTDVVKLDGVIARGGEQLRLCRHPRNVEDRIRVPHELNGSVASSLALLLPWEDGGALGVGADEGDDAILVADGKDTRAVVKRRAKRRRFPERVHVVLFVAAHALEQHPARDCGAGSVKQAGGQHKEQLHAVQQQHRFVLLGGYSPLRGVRYYRARVPGVPHAPWMAPSSRRSMVWSKPAECGIACSRRCEEDGLAIPARANADGEAIKFAPRREAPARMRSAF